MSTDTLYTRPALRLELLRLVYRHDKSAEEITGRASQLEEYLLESAPSAATDPVVKEKSARLAGNARAPADSRK